jgi:hypothetical protein
VTTVIHALDHLLSLVPAGYQRRRPPHGVLPSPHRGRRQRFGLGVRLERPERCQEGGDVVDGQIGLELDGRGAVGQEADCPGRGPDDRALEGSDRQGSRIAHDLGAAAEPTLLRCLPEPDVVPESRLGVAIQGLRYTRLNRGQSPDGVARTSTHAPVGRHLAGSRPSSCGRMFSASSTSTGTVRLSAAGHDRAVRCPGDGCDRRSRRRQPAEVSGRPRHHDVAISPTTASTAANRDQPPGSWTTRPDGPLPRGPLSGLSASDSLDTRDSMGMGPARPARPPGQSRGPWVPMIYAGWTLSATNGCRDASSADTRGGQTVGRRGTRRRPRRRAGRSRSRRPRGRCTPRAAPRRAVPGC